MDSEFVPGYYIHYKSLLSPEEPPRAYYAYGLGIVVVESCRQKLRHVERCRSSENEFYFCHIGEGAGILPGDNIYGILDEQKSLDPSLQYVAYRPMTPSALMVVRPRAEFLGQVSFEKTPVPRFSFVGAAVPSKFPLSA